MEKINFKDLPSKDTPIDSKNLNLLQANVENAINNLNGTVLFEGSANNDFQLSESVSNYNFIEFFYQTSNNISKSVKVPSSAGYATLETSLYSTTASKFILYTRTINISGQNITNYSYQILEITNSQTQLVNANNIIVTKVIGYK